MAKKNKFQKRVSKYQGVKVSKERGVDVAQLSSRRKLALAVVLLVTSYLLLVTVNLFLADVSFNSGERAQRYGLYETAVGYYNGAISLNPREPRYHRELASVLAKLGIVEEAEREAEIAYQLNPKNSLTVRSLISTYVDLSDIDPKYLTRAEELISETIAQQPTNPQLYYKQALILFESEKDEEAVESLQKGLELKPDYQKARELLESSPHNLN